MSLLAAAVHNNAMWCDAVCRAFGCDTTWVDGLWLNRSPAPPYYSNGVTTDAVSTAAQAARVRQMLDSPLPRPWTIKDGFRVLDLSTMGFEVLFEAEWLTRPAEQRAASPTLPGLRWATVADDPGLVAWERAWRGDNEAAAGVERLFGARLLSDPDLRFLAAWEGERIAAVVAANRSDGGSGPVVGISNIVLAGDDPERYRPGVVAAVQEAFPGLPLVGYERGDDLNAMASLGFRSLGPLRVWTSPA